ncbi:MAG: site-specific integrase [Kutzneria sp.]|nr:site-specific integrase [Kutzneria sp.]
MGVPDSMLPEPVSAALRHGTRSVLVDAAALDAVRDRFDHEQAASLAHYLRISQSANTVRAYRSDWLAWSAWCVAEGRTALPADPLDVAVYLAAAADAVRADANDVSRPAFSPATLDRKAAAIAAIHAANGLPSPTRSDVVRLTLRGIRRARNAQPTRKRPVLLGTLEALLAERPEDGWPTGVARRRDALLLLMGFAGALRREELAALTTDAVEVGADARMGEPLLTVDLGVTKTDPTGVHHQQVVLPRGGRPHTCPVCAFADWTDVLRTHSESGHEGLRRWLTDTEGVPRTVHRCHTYVPADMPRQPLFPSVSRHGRLGQRPMTGRAVADLIKRHATRAGLDPTLFSGHSLRAGFATQAALGGATDREIMRQGRWTNPRTVHRYIRTANPLDDNAVTKLGL